MSAISVATIAATIGLSGCAGDDRDRPVAAAPAADVSAVAAPNADPGPPPAPEALSDVLYRLADTAIPGADKLSLVGGAVPADATTLDAFGTALRDDGFAPITVTASDIRPSDVHPDRVLATITITAADPDDPREFAFPMEFQPGARGWQLTRETGDMLLAVGPAGTGPTPGG